MWTATGIRVGRGHSGLPVFGGFFRNASTKTSIAGFVGCHASPRSRGQSSSGITFFFAADAETVGQRNVWVRVRRCFGYIAQFKAIQSVTADISIDRILRGQNDTVAVEESVRGSCDSEAASLHGVCAEMERSSVRDGKVQKDNLVLFQEQKNSKSRYQPARTGIVCGASHGFANIHDYHC